MYQGEGVEKGIEKVTEEMMNEMLSVLNINNKSKTFIEPQAQETVHQVMS